MLLFFLCWMYFIQDLRIADGICQSPLPVICRIVLRKILPGRVFGGFCPEVFGAIDGSPVDTSEISRRHR